MTGFAPHAHSYRRAKARVRFGVGIWLLALAAYACYSGLWWGVLLVAPAALQTDDARRVDS